MISLFQISLSVSLIMTRYPRLDVCESQTRRFGARSTPFVIDTFRAFLPTTLSIPSKIYALCNDGVVGVMFDSEQTLESQSLALVSPRTDSSRLTRRPKNHLT